MAIFTRAEEKKSRENVKIQGHWQNQQKETRGCEIFSCIFPTGVLEYAQEAQGASQHKGVESAARAAFCSAWSAKGNKGR